MRRPTPIPSRGGDDDGASRPGEIHPDLAPVLPLSPAARGAAREDSAADEAAPQLDDGAIPDTPAHDDERDADVSADAPGWRYVWRAARARRRALRAEMRRFTVRQRRRRLIWSISIGAVLLLVLGSVAAAYSPLFAVEEIAVEGTEQLDAEAVAAALDDQLGVPLALVDASDVKAALIGFPLVESYTIEARPPHELVVRIVERTPVGAVASDAGYSIVDAAGVVLATVQNEPSDVPLMQIEGGTSSDAFAAAGQVLRTLPAALLLQVRTVTATTPNDVTLTLDGDVRVVWGSADQSALKARTLETAREAAPDAGSYDVSSPDAVVIG